MKVLKDDVSIPYREESHQHSSNDTHSTMMSCHLF